jgi:hypothetical protein
MINRHGFVSNSSSTSFIIENKTKERLHLCEFIKENSHLIEEFELGFNIQIIGEFRQSHTGKILKISSLDDAINLMCQEAKELEESRGMYWSSARTKALAPGENSVQFGDEQGTLLGEIYDYILREGGESKRFRWRFDFYNR